MILVLAGTQGGRLVVEMLQKAGIPAMATSATPTGEMVLREDFEGRILCGHLGAEEMEKVIRDHGIKVVVDATHPFAIEVSKNAEQACTKTGVELICLEREGVSWENLPDIHGVEDMEEAARLAASFSGNVFLTIGSSKLEYFVGIVGLSRLIVRVLPIATSLQVCADLGLKPRQIIAMQGPFSQEVNEVLFQYFRTGVVVTKESAKAGGLEEKVSAAQMLSIPLIVVRRPGLSYRRKFFSPKELSEYIAEHW